MSTEWTPEPGERVVRVRADRHNRAVIDATVLRVGKRDIVLDDGCRFKVNGLSLREGGTYGWTQKLMQPGDPFVANLRSEIQRANQVTRAKVTAEKFAYGRDGVTAFDAILALAPLTGVADEIQALDHAAGDWA